MLSNMVPENSLTFLNNKLSTALQTQTNVEELEGVKEELLSLFTSR